MERREFLSNASSGIVTVCLCGLAACSKSDNYSGGTNPPGGSILLTIDLNSQLINVGDSFKDGSKHVILVRTAGGNMTSSFIAVTDICTHMQCSVNYNSGNNKYECPCHGSVYNVDGSVSNGPAPSALRKYLVEINGTTLTVKA